MKTQIYYVIPSEEEKYKQRFANGKTWHNNLWQSASEYVAILHHYKEIVKKQGEVYKQKAEENKKIFVIETLKKIVNSEWFSRAWTYQDGWFSKQTIFVFDDVLIDGRLLAQAWVTFQQKNNYLNNDLEKFATPLGWTYGYNSEDRLSLGLFEALNGVKNRGRGVPIDGIYSILGLLPYGDKVRVNYKEWGREYTKEDLEEALLDVMKVAVREGYGEPLAWHGEGNGWMPKIDKNGSTSVEGAIKIRCKPESIEFSENGIKVTASRYVISEIQSSMSKMEKGSLIDVRMYMRNILVKSDKDNEVTLLGTKETLQRIKKGDVLLVPNKDELKSDKPFAILATKKEDSSYHRIGLVELLSEDLEKLQGIEERVIIGQDNQLQAQIEIPPK